MRGACSLCDYCRSRLPWLERRCRQCGISLPLEIRSSNCGRCLLHPPPFTLCYGLFDYVAPVSGLIAEFKYRRNFASGRVLAQQLTEAFLCYYRNKQTDKNVSGLPALLVPVPLHENRLRARGFNQALWLARILSRYSGIPVAQELVMRTRDTPSQSQLTSRQRAANLRGAFRLTAEPTGIELGHIAIIDDVVTTTTTVREVTNALFKAGAGRVDVWSLARAGHQPVGLTTESVK